MGPGDAQNQGNVRDQTVGHSEDGGAGATGLDVSVMVVGLDDHGWQRTDERSVRTY
jgi:hypothetical protein